MDNEAIYNKHMKLVYGFFMSKTFNRQLTEDLTSDVFITAFEQFEQRGDSIDDKEKYLYGVMKLTWTQYLRRKYQNPEFNADNVEDFERYAVRTVQETKSKSLIERAIPFIEQLPEKQREVMLLRFRDGLSLSEICQKTSHDMNYVKTTQKRGLASLKKQVQGELL